MAEGELESLRLEPADGGFTLNIHRHHKEGKRGETSEPSRSKPKIAHNADHALEIIAKEIGAKGRKRGKGLTVMNEGESAQSRKKLRKSKSAARKRA